ncbi:hypothetical protein [Pseudomonas boanensis]|uniref:hypothetical protein n=1 Tax=Metapseudomonas boanensis TaxID=2822138 RepID=UPI0035D46352
MELPAQVVIAGSWLMLNSLTALDHLAIPMAASLKLTAQSINLITISKPIDFY